MRSLATILLVLSVSFVFGQKDPKGLDAENNLRQLGTTHSVSGRHVRVFRDKTVEGSPYLYEDWLPGAFWITTGKKFESKVMYNGFDDYVMYVNDQNQPLIVVNAIQFRIDSPAPRLFRKLEFTNSDGSERSGFYEVLYEGKVRLFVKRVKEFKPAPAVQTYSTGSQRAGYEEINEVVIELDGSFHELNKVTKKVIMALFSDREEEIKTFMKKEHLFPAKDNDLARIVEYYDSLN